MSSKTTRFNPLYRCAKCSETFTDDFCNWTRKTIAEKAVLFPGSALPWQRSIPYREGEP